MQNRAYSFLEVKSFDDRKRIIQGVATTPTVDRSATSSSRWVNPLRQSARLPLAAPARQPIGMSSSTSRPQDGITFKAEFVNPEEPEDALKDRLDEAWQSIKPAWCAR
jgi:hypothetical protein